MAEARIFYQEDCNQSLLEGKKICIIGYGSQGHAHALNLKDSGCDVVVGLYEGSKSKAKAEAQGLNPFAVGLFLFGRFDGFLGWRVISGWYGVLVFGNIVRIRVNFLRIAVFVVVFAVYSVRVA